MNKQEPKTTMTLVDHSGNVSLLHLHPDFSLKNPMNPKKFDSFEERQAQIQNDVAGPKPSTFQLHELVSEVKVLDARRLDKSFVHALQA